MYDAITPPPQGNAVEDDDFPVLRPILAQTLHPRKPITAGCSNVGDAARWLLCNPERISKCGVPPDEAQKRLLTDLFYGMDELSEVIRLHAAPGCGKSAFCCMLLRGLCESDEENLTDLRPLRWITAPTKALVNDIVDMAFKLLPSDMIAPVGNRPDAEDRQMIHFTSLRQDAFLDQLEAIEEAVQKIKGAWDAYLENSLWYNYTKLLDVLNEACLMAADFYNGPAYEEHIASYYKSVRVIISTAPLNLKCNANEPNSVAKIKRTSVRPGCHFADEADASSLSCLVGACVDDAFLFAPTDPAQHMTGFNNMARIRDGSHYERAKPK